MPVQAPWKWFLPQSNFQGARTGTLEVVSSQSNFQGARTGTLAVMTGNTLISIKICLLRHGPRRPSWFEYAGATCCGTPRLRPWQHSATGFEPKQHSATAALGLSRRQQLGLSRKFDVANPSPTPIPPPTNYPSIPYSSKETDEKTKHRDINS